MRAAVHGQRRLLEPHGLLTAAYQACASSHKRRRRAGLLPQSPSVERLVLSALPSPKPWSKARDAGCSQSVKKPLKRHPTLFLALYWGARCAIQGTTRPDCPFTEEHQSYLRR
jgi:hypothetical protein